MSDLTVRELLDQMRDMERRATEAMKRQYPIGSEVRYEHGAHTRSVVVLDHNPFSPRLLVRGATGRTYWLDVYRVLREEARGG